MSRILLVLLWLYVHERDPTLWTRYAWPHVPILIFIGGQVIASDFQICVICRKLTTAGVM